MAITIELDPFVEGLLRERAAREGKTPEDVAKGLVSRELDALAWLREISGPIGETFARSGMTEDELSDFLEEEKHAMRAERRAALAAASGAGPSGQG